MRETCYQHEQKILQTVYGDDHDTVADFATYIIEPITPDAARTFIRDNEWLRSTGHPVAGYAARTPHGDIAIVALFGRPNLITNDPHTIVLERGARAYWTHPHIGSWFIPRAVKLAARDHGWHTFIAYADPDAGEVGAVYQACNWLYVGNGRENGRPRDYFEHIDGKTISEKAFRARGLTMADVDDLIWTRIKKPAKHKYVHIEAPPRLKKKLRRQFTPLPYPKNNSSIRREIAR